MDGHTAFLPLLPLKQQRLPPALRKTYQKRTSCCCEKNEAHKFSRRSFSTIVGGIALSSIVPPTKGALVKPAVAGRPEGVNRPELLPKEFTTVIDLERFLASGEIRRLQNKIADLEKRTGFKVRVLTQRFPQTPGLAVRDYWAVDDNTVVMVADYFGGSGQLLKYNVGANVDKLLPPRFWSVLSADLGNKFYVQKNGEAMAILNSIESIRTCLLNNGCSVPPKLDPSF